MRCFSSKNKQKASDSPLKSPVVHKANDSNSSSLNLQDLHRPDAKIARQIDSVPALNQAVQNTLNRLGAFKYNDVVNSSLP